ncbi:hypothetical protein Bca4012_035031 [Brassica carinata]
MLGLSHKDDHSSSGFWSSDVDGVSYIQLHKFWSELSPKARQELLRVDRQSLFEQARKNMCCSRCNSLLLECFLQIVSQGSNSLQLNGSKDQSFVSHTAVSQWGGLTATRDGSLTLLDCYLYAKSFKVLQTVFESARARERERELLYPDACGGDGRVWISQGVSGYGKGYGTRESCALHTTWLSCDTLVDFWSALEDESRQSLFTMKEEDFIDKLTSRFDCKKFCRDCRKNVIREFKALKEIKRMQRKPQCTEWFCVSDTAFQYQVGVDSVRADWSQYFTENAGYHQFEWAVGTDKGESDILDFKRVGSSRSAQASGLDLHGLKECYITLRAFKKNGRASEISVKAHALGCQQCVHSRLVVGDGYVSIKRGKCIRMFFEHAEEVEEEENEVTMDKDGNELDGECFRPQKHAKSPELAREFLLDAAMVIFKEQVERAFRDGTARQNAHSIFVCLSSKLLEQRVHVACKEIITLEKQNKLLEEEEKEKREEEERKERKRTKEREKKLRRKERLKEKELEKEQKNPKFIDKEREKRAEEGSMNLDEESNSTVNCEDSGIETGDVELSPPGSPDDQDGECLDDCITSTADTQYSDSTDRDIIDHTNDSPGPAHQTGKFCLEPSSRHLNGSNGNMRVKALKAGGKPNSIKSQQGFQCSDKRNGERYDDHSCSYKPNNGFWEKADSNISATRGMPVTVRKVLDSTQLNHPRNSSHSEAEEVVEVALKSADTQSLYKATEKLGDTIHIDCNKVSGNYISPTEEDKKMEVHITSKNDDMFSKDPMMSRSSSSDNCSSCLSEGDSNTASSNSGNSGSSPMSDLEEKLVDNENDMHDCHEKMMEKETENSADERDLLRIKKMSNHPAENGESKLSETPSTVLSQSMDNTVPSVITGSYLPQPQSMMFPQMQSIPLPVFQAPYYHQAPVSWSAAPANGLMPFPHPNHYVYAGTLGYSLNGDSPLCLQYGTPLNHSATPFFNSGPAPVFHPFAEINTVNAAEQVQTLDPLEHGYLKEAADERKINGISPLKTPCSRGQETVSGEDFSLFHFGGPVSRGKSNHAYPKDGVLRDFSLQFTRDHVFSDNNKKKKEKTVGEEYNLFGESNSLRRDRRVMMAHKDDHSSSSGFWSSDVDGVSYIQLHKFWSELSPKDRQELLRIDRQSLFEQARKNMCCSRCHGLLLEGFLQLVSSQQKGTSKDDGNNNNSALSNPDVHQWGGLTATRDESLTLLDCYLYPKSFKVIQTVFESARARERERELLYPDACGGDGRVWISQGVSGGYGKGYGTREACALHTRWLSCDTLVDFYSALEDESRQSLFTMKEEDFIGRLTSRFDRKKFCRDCRKNVIREFKALKEIKRMQRKPQCTEWFCVADTAFQYQVGIDSVRADWSQYFTENAGYHQFEWAIGTDKGESDILGFKRVGSNRSAQVSGLHLHGLKECYITLRAFKKNGRSSEISVKAHALGCQQCVHSRLVVGDGFVSIRRGKCIRMFFEHAEEVEEEENEVDKDGNELDGECFRPQKHAKSPELAREFLLDAATVIFKEQVEKAFRDGTARQNAHSIFVCLSSKLLEQRVYVACKEIITSEKQKKLLEEEENEKREEEVRKERKKTKEREKKLRKKERVKEKEREKEQKNPKFMDKAMLPNFSREEEGSMDIDEESNNTIICGESGTETGDVELSPPGSPDDDDRECLDGCITSTAETHYSDSNDREITDHENGCCTNDSQGPVHQTERLWKELQPDYALRVSDKCRYPENASFVHMAETRNCNDSLELSSRHRNGSNKNIRVKALKAGGKPNSNRNGDRYNDHSCSYKPINGHWEKVESNVSATRGMPVTVRKVLDSTQLKHPRNSSHSDAPPVTCSIFKAEEVVDVSSTVKLADTQSECNATEKLGNANHSDYSWVSGKYINPTENDDLYSKDPIMSRTSSSDNCSSCLSDGDSNTASSNSGNTESSPMSDPEDASQHFEGREKLVGTENDVQDCHEKMIKKETEKSVDERDLLRIKKMSNHPAEDGENELSETPLTVLSQNMENTVPTVNTGSYLSQPQSMMFPQIQSIPLPVFQAPSTMGYYHQAPVSWSAAPANGLMPFPHPNHYVYAGPLAYSLNGESPLCVQYGTPLNHSATPFFHSGPAPIFYPFSEINTMNTVDQVQTLEPKGAADERKINGFSQVETPSSRGPQTDSGEDFSLFHYSGPVAGSNSIPADSIGILRDFSMQLSGDHAFGDHTMKKKVSAVGEEYSLFAESNNSMRFSIF